MGRHQFLTNCLVKRRSENEREPLIQMSSTLVQPISSAGYSGFTWREDEKSKAANPARQYRNPWLERRVELIKA
jgi:hypothetical protein